MNKPSHVLRASLLFVLLFTLLPPTYASAYVGCLDEDNNPVDWWVILKAPASYKYIYRDANTQDPTFSAPKANLNDHARGALSNTMNAFYASNKNPNVGYIAYNDQPPTGQDQGDFAHAKGLLAFDENLGFWLIHSIPHFPSSSLSSKSYAGLPSSSFKYGQSLFCVTYPINAYAEIGAQLEVDGPYIMQRYLPPTLQPQIDNNLANIKIDGPQTRVAQLTSLGGVLITSVAKTKQWQMDFYEDLLAPTLASDLLVRTWMLSGENLPTSCTGADCHSTYFNYDAVQRRVKDPICNRLCTTGSEDQCHFAYSTMQVNKVKFSRDIEIAHQNDHSKWAITAPNSAHPMVCIGDMNTQKGQRSRGGGTACIEDQAMWNALYSLISDRDTCPNGS